MIDFSQLPPSFAVLPVAEAQRFPGHQIAIFHAETASLTPETLRQLPDSSASCQENLTGLGPANAIFRLRFVFGGGDQRLSTNTRSFPRHTR